MQSKQRELRVLVKHLFFRLFGMKMTGYLRLYAPHSLVRAYLVRKRYRRYMQQASKNYHGPRKVQEELASDGIMVLNGAVPLSPELLHEIYREFENGDCISYKAGFFKPGIDKTAEYTYLTVQTIRRLNLVGSILSSNLVPLIELHLGCYVRIVNFVVYKTYPNTSTQFGSFLWHRDSQPENSWKFIIYLSEVGPQDGAFAYVPGSHKTYNGLPQFGNSRLSGLPSHHREYCGRSGDALLFDVNGYHRGGTSTGKERIVMVVHVKPSKIPCEDHYRRHGFGSVADPEFGTDPGRVWW